MTSTFYSSLRLFILYIILLLLCESNLVAQDTDKARRWIQELCSNPYAGRGYVKHGANKAAEYLSAQMKQIGLKPLPNMSTNSNNPYLQSYTFDINTHPNEIRCEVDKRKMIPGIDFLVGPGSPSANGTYTLLHFNPNDSVEKQLLYKKIRKGFAPQEVIVLHKTSSRKHPVWDSIKLHGAPSLLLFTEEKKLTHSLRTTVDEVPSLIFIDSVLQMADKLTIQFENQYLKNNINHNVLGYLPAKKSKKYIVFTAHYDHLGMMGNQAIFPGASDNASGTAMVLMLADYFKHKKNDDNILFILFSGEEAGLLGSEYFVANTPIALSDIKMLINIDIMGDAEKGITVVNGETWKEQFDELVAINQRKKYLPEVRIRGKASNSDHHHFSENNVPSFFIYSMGGKGYYHDIFDTPDNCALTNYLQVAQLLIDFVSKQ